MLSLKVLGVAMLLGAGPAQNGGMALSLEPDGELLDAYAGQLAYAPDGKTWVTGEQRVIGVYQGLARVRELKDVWVDTGDALAFSADGKRLLAGHAILDAADGKALFSANADALTGYAERGWAIDAARFTPDGAQLLAWLKFHPSACCREESRAPEPGRKAVPPVVVVDTASGKGTPLPLDGEGWGEFRALAAGERQLVVGGVASKAWVFDRKTLARVATLDTGTAYYDFRFSADGRTLLGVHLGRELVAYDTATWKRRAAWTVLPDGKWISAVATHPKLPVVAVSGWDGQLRLYSFAPGEEGRLLAQLPLGQASALAFSPSGAELLVAVPGYPRNRIVRLAVKAK